ncbi:hypothetical protein C8F04DRAFT_1238523 [Mycena alexandri]|uniref:Uncharacterized protein n=1 Tax=Mycena alexandri TaxID=1745969 RepID=A0AAD6SFG7_9AGAR|nr:hypothetical protein C8F04DRAFT_1238523 [Mycena alexandri]
MSRFPPQVLLHIFSFVQDNETFHDGVAPNLKEEWDPQTTRDDTEKFIFRTTCPHKSVLLDHSLRSYHGELHTATTNLPSLWRLRLHFCGPPVGIAATDAIHHDGPPAALDQEGNAVEALERWALHRHNLTIVPLALLGGLKALTISSEHQPPRSPPSAYRNGHVDSFFALNAPLLEVFRDPASTASAVANSAAHIVECTLTDEISSPTALRVLAHLHARSLTALPSASALHKIVHRYSAPGEEFLFNLGPQPLDHMPRLDTPLIQARPGDAVWQAPTPSHFRDPWRPRKWDEDAWQRSVPPPPTVAATREWLAVWKKYTPLLELVDLGGRRWTREFHASEWATDGVVVEV